MEKFLGAFTLFILGNSGHEIGPFSVIRSKQFYSVVSLLSVFSSNSYLFKYNQCESRQYKQHNL